MKMLKYDQINNKIILIGIIMNLLSIELTIQS